MKKFIPVIILLIFTSFAVLAQKTKDVLYLKNGSVIFGKLLEIKDGQYKMQTADGSTFNYKADEIDKFTKETPQYDGRKVTGFSFAMEAGLLAGAQHTDYSAPFSFNFLTGIISKTSNIFSFGSGVEFFGMPYTPLFIEYKRLINNKNTAPFFFCRGGALVQLGGNDSDTPPINNNYQPFNYKGGGSFAFGSGISWAKTDYETYLSFGYRYAHTSYQRKEYNNITSTYQNSLNRLEIKFGFRF
jgi:hypothetical protein